jgi:hypothetical protein
MKTLELLAILFALISGGSLATIQIRRIIKKELPLFGFGQIMSAAKIDLDKFDKIMVLISGISFVVFIVLTLTNLS